MNNIAIIDLGTNTCNLLIANHKGHILYSEKKAIGLGKGGISKDTITKEAFDRALNTMQYYKHKALQWNPISIQAIATSAVRNANNGEELAKAIRLQTGIAMHIISGLEEAKYIFKGVQRAMDLGSRMNLIIDIGAGSVEYIIGNKTQMVWSQSFEIGALRLFEKFHTRDPFPRENIGYLNEYLTEQLAQLYEAVHQYKPQVLIGSSGSFDTLAEIDFRKKNPETTYSEHSEYSLRLSDYHPIANQLIHYDRNSRKAVPGMAEMRVEMIVIACLLIDFTIKQFNLESIRVSSFSLKEGYLSSLLSGEQV